MLSLRPGNWTTLVLTDFAFLKICILNLRNVSAHKRFKEQKYSLKINKDVLKCGGFFFVKKKTKNNKQQGIIRLTICLHEKKNLIKKS